MPFRAHAWTVAALDVQPDLALAASNSVTHLAHPPRQPVCRHGIDRAQTVAAALQIVDAAGPRPGLDQQSSDFGFDLSGGVTANRHHHAPAGARPPAAIL